MKKTLYWDIETEARIEKIREKVAKKTGRNDWRVSDSRISRVAIRLTPFDKMVAALQKEINEKDTF